MRRAAAVAVLFLGWTTAAHAAPMKLYVSAGGPVTGAAVTVNGVAAAHPTDAHGFVVVDIPAKTRFAKIVAAGGRMGGIPVRGALLGGVPYPLQRRALYVNPVSTVVAQYLALNPHTSEAIARERVRTLFALKPNDDIDRALRYRARYFDGQRFLRYADAHGGVDTYARRLAQRIDRRHGSVTFIAPDLDITSILEALKTPMSVASSTLGIISGTASIVNDIIGWTKKPQPSNGQIYQTEQQIETQLTQIDQQLAGISDEISTDFTNLQASLSTDSYNTAVNPVKLLAGEIESAHEDYEDLTANAVSPSFSQTIYTQDSADLASNMALIEDQFNVGDDLMHDAILSGTSSAYYLLANYLQSQTDSFWTYADTAALDDFRNYVMYYQALAFQLIATYQASGATGTAVSSLPKLHDAIVKYLGSDTDWKAWTTANPPGSTPTAPPASGDLHDEFTYLQSISDIPAGAILDPTGLMWWSTAIGPNPNGGNNIDLSQYIANNAGCDWLYYSGVAPGSYSNSYYADESWGTCQNLWQGFRSAEADEATALSSFASVAGLSGWVPATADQVATLALTTNSGSYVTGPDGNPLFASSYGIWDGSMWCASSKSSQQTCPSGNDYYLTTQSFGQSNLADCGFNPDNHCNNDVVLVGKVITGVNIRIYAPWETDTTATTCSVAVDGSTSQACGGPVLGLLPMRTPAPGEKYRP